MGIRVERFSLGFGKILWSKRKGDTEYAISAVPLGGYVKMAGEEPSDKHEGKPYEFYAKPPGKRFWVLFSGAALNYIFALILFSFIVFTPRIGYVVPESPAYEAGLKTGDNILSIDEKKIDYWHQMQNIVSANIGSKPLRLEIDRDGKVKIVTIVPEVLESEGMFGRTSKRGMLGVGYYGDVTLLKANPLICLKTGFRQTLNYSLLTYRVLWYIVTGKVAAKDTLSGPVRIVRDLAKAVDVGFLYLLYFVALINLALAIFNLLPIPVLDGGHILFLGIERIRKRPLNVKTQEVVQYIGFSLLLALMLFVTWNDISNIFFKK